MGGMGAAERIRGAMRGLQTSFGTVGDFNRALQTIGKAMRKEEAGRAPKGRTASAVIVDEFHDVDRMERRLLLIECRNELWRWARRCGQSVTIDAVEASTARELVRKIENALDLPDTARRVS